VNQNEGWIEYVGSATSKRLLWIKNSRETSGSPLKIIFVLLTLFLRSLFSFVRRVHSSLILINSSFFLIRHFLADWRFCISLKNQKITKLVHKAIHAWSLNKESIEIMTEQSVKKKNSVTKSEWAQRLTTSKSINASWLWLSKNHQGIKQDVKRGDGEFN